MQLDASKSGFLCFHCATETFFPRPVLYSFADTLKYKSAKSDG